MNESFSEWLGDFFRSYYELRPVNATFTGIHQHDSRLPDFTDEGIATLRSSMEQLLERSLTIKTHSRTETIDLMLASSFLTIQLEELRNGIHQRNPALYSSEAVFGLVSLCLRDNEPRDERMASMSQRMEAIPRFLTIGESNVRSAPKEWTNEAIRQCDGAIRFLESGVRILLSEWSVSGAGRFLENARLALGAFRNYRDYLSAELLSHDGTGYAAGREFFDTLLRKGHCFREMDAEKLLSYGKRRFAEQNDVLLRETGKLRADRDWRIVLADLSNQHPSAEDIITSCQRCWNDCRDVAIENNLVSWPDYPLRYRFTPSHLQEAAPFLYFLSYRSPPPFDETAVNDFLLSPIIGPPEREELVQRLRAFNFATIKQNFVVHHGAIGHHLQNYYAYQCASAIGRIAAVDCASRIAMFCGGTMAEGWATYATSLMDEFGFNTPPEHIAELHSRLRLAGRVVVDTNLHLGRYSFEDAVQFYVTEIGMTPKMARAEVIKNSMFPGTGVMYLLGMDTISDLRKSLASRQGQNFTLRRFHHSILSYGSIPVAIIAGEVGGR